MSERGAIRMMVPGRGGIDGENGGGRERNGGWGKIDKRMRRG